MTTKTIEIRQAQSQLDELVSLAMAGTEVVFTRGNKPLARLTPIPDLPMKQRTPGLHQGAIWMSEDFDDPLPESFWFEEGT